MPEPIQAVKDLQAFRRYTVAMATVAAAALLAVLPRSDWAEILADERFWLLAAFVVIGESLPMRVPRRDGHDFVTVSTAFAVAVLLAFGAGPAMVVYAVASVVSDVLLRARLVNLVFNAAQYVVSVGLAAIALGVAGDAAPVHVGTGTLPAIVACAVTFFVANQVLAGAGSAVLNRTPVARYLLEDLPFHAVTGGFVLALAPVVVASADASVVLIPLCFVPMLAIYLGGRQAAVNGHRATHDVLTDLPNRELLRERLGSAFDRARRNRGQVVVLILDLDDFKAVNDTLGHVYGDELLRLLAPRLTQALHADDMLARLGGDEFAVLLGAGQTVEDGRRVADRMLRALDEPFDVESLALDVRASVGIAAYPMHGRDPDELLQHADQALYRAKAEGVDFEVYASEHDDHSLDRLALAGQLRRGIAQGQLTVYYQPKVPFGDGVRLGVEALVRWEHPLLGLIGPDGFIGLAEQSGLIGPLTDHVLCTALRQRAGWEAEGLDVVMSVNLSSRSLLEHGLVDRIAALTHAHGTPRGALQLEITETRIVADLRRARVVLEQLRAMGVTIAIDDFGTGFSSLAQLQQLCVDEIKIDKSFVLNMHTNGNDAAIVRSTVHLGRDLGLRVTAEGVESEGVLHQLRELGCDYAQGFYLGRPAAPGECARALRQSLAARGASMPRARLGVVG